MGIRTDFSWLLASKFACMGAGLVPAMLMNRALEPAGRGVLAEMQSWVALFAVLFGLSLESAVYHIADARQHPEPQAEKFSTLLGATLACAGTAALAVALFAWLAPDMLSAQARQHLAPMALLLVCMMLGTQLVVFFQAAGEIPFIAKLNLAQTGITVAVVGLGYLGGALSVPFALWALVAAQIPLIVLALLGAWRSGLLRLGFTPRLARILFASGAKLHVATIATFAYTKVNQLIVNRYAGDQEAGFFAVALNLAFTAMLIPQALQGALYPRVIHSQDEAEVTAKAMRVTLFGWGAATLLLGALAEPIILVYAGAKFLPAVPAFRLCLLGMLFLSLSSLVSPLFIKRGAFGIASAMAVALGGIALGLNLLLVPGGGATEAALATALTTGVGLAGSLLFYRHLCRTGPVAPQEQP